MEAACLLLSNTLDITTNSLAMAKSFAWEQIVDTGLRHQIVRTQEAAAETYAVYSGFTEFSELLKR